MAEQDWNGKICLVTGATSGFGAALSRTFATRGATVILVARNIDRLQQAAESLQQAGHTVDYLAADVTQQEDVDRLKKDVVEKFGRLDLLCNCVGQSTRGRILDCSPEDFQQLLDVNFLATVRMTRACVDLLTASHGHVVNIGSLASKVAARYLGGYAPGKFALAAYTQQLRLETRPDGLHVLLVCPGPIQRNEAGPRYAEQAADVPNTANQPAAGAKLKGIDPHWLAERVVKACERREPELVVPGRVRLLLALAQLSPRLGDWLLLKFTGG